MANDSLLERYSRALRDRSQEALALREELRAALVERVAAALEHHSAGDLLEELRQLFQIARAEVSREATDVHLSLELGALSTLLSLVQLNTGEAVGDAAREVVREGKKLAMLQALAQGARSKGDLASLIYPELPGAPAMITRATKTLSEAGLIHESRDGRRHVVSLSAAGARLLELVEQGEVRAAVRYEGEPYAFDEQVVRVSLTTSADTLPLKELQDKDRPRYHLYVSALLMGREFLLRPRWTHEDRWFAQSLTMFPLGDTPNDREKQVLEKLPSRLPSKHLLSCLFQHQTDSERRELANEWLRIGRHMADNAHTLLWAPCAVTSAVRLSATRGTFADIRLREDLLQLAYEKLGEVPYQVPAKHWRGVIAKVVNRPELCREHWASLVHAATLPPGQSTEVDQAIGRRVVQVKRSGPLNMALARFEDALSIIKQGVAARGAPLRDGDGGEEAASELAAWSFEHRYEVAEQVSCYLDKEQPSELLASARNLLAIGKAALSGHHSEPSPDFETIVKRHVDQAAWVLGMNERIVETEQAEAPPRMEATQEWYCKAIMNNFWSQELVWVDLARDAAARDQVRTHQPSKEMVAQ